MELENLDHDRMAAFLKSARYRLPPFVGDEATVHSGIDNLDREFILIVLEGRKTGMLGFFQ